MVNSVASALRIIGMIEIIAGIILGLLLGNNHDLYGYSTNWAVVFLWFGAGFVSGMLFIGLSEVIELLHKINSKLGHESELNEDVKKEVYTRKEASELYETQMSDKKDINN